jgi:macrolide phosphotransferase
VGVTRTPLALAALASAAVQGLDPATVKGVAHRPGRQFEVAFVEDTQHRRWVVRAPQTAAAGAQMDGSVALLGALARRLPFAVPAPKGFVALKGGGRAMVYPYIAGRPLDFAHLPAGPGIAAELGRALAALHNLDLSLCEEAGLTSYDPDTYRTRRLSDLDRAATTGHVPAGLLSRWERALEDVSLWRFAPTATHGDLTGHEVLALFDSEDDAASGHIRGLTGWENAKVADPADDFATLVTQASPAAFDSVLEAYAHARLDRPDQYLERRARLAGELKLVSELLSAVSSDSKKGIEVCADRLRRLDAKTFDDLDDELVAPAPRAVPVRRDINVPGRSEDGRNGDEPLGIDGVATAIYSSHDTERIDTRGTDTRRTAGAPIDSDGTDTERIDGDGADTERIDTRQLHHADRANAYRSDSDRSDSDRSNTDRANADHTDAERPAADRAAAERPPAERPAVDERPYIAGRFGETGSDQLNRLD